MLSGGTLLIGSDIPVAGCALGSRHLHPGRDLCRHMTRKKSLQDFTADDLMDEMARRHAEQNYVPGMTMSQMELSVWRAFGAGAQAQLAMARLLSRMKSEKTTGKPCPKCGRRTPVKAAQRERTLKSLIGPLTLMRNYHYCDGCQFGFYPLDRLLELPEEGELTSELFRSVVSRVGAQCEEADQGRLQEQLKAPSDTPPDLLVVMTDGSMVPICGDEPWKEAKVGVVYRHDADKNEAVAETERYTAVVGGMSEFAPVLEEALELERIDEAGVVVWVGDGAPCNWTLADQLAPDAVQILDWYHAVENAMKCGKLVLGDESPYLSLWKERIEALLMGGDPELVLAEVMACIPEAERQRRGKHDALAALDDLARYYRANASRMKYAMYREHGFPIGTGAVESAHRHVLQVRMKRAGQRWAMRTARRMCRLRAAYRTGGAQHFHAAIQRAHRDTTRLGPLRRERRRNFRYARYGQRDLDNARSTASK